MFDEDIATDVAAYFINKANGSMPKLKLLALMYLADRERCNKYGTTITNDLIMAMKHGPTLINTYCLINGSIYDVDRWNDLIVCKDNNTVQLRKPLTEDDSGHLSESYENILNKILNEFGNLEEEELIQYTQSLPEWKYPKEYPTPITPENMLIALNKTPDEIKNCLEFINETDSWDRLMRRMTKG